MRWTKAAWVTILVLSVAPACTGDSGGDGSGTGSPGSGATGGSGGAGGDSGGVGGGSGVGGATGGGSGAGADAIAEQLPEDLRTIPIAVMLGAVCVKWTECREELGLGKRWDTLEGCLWSFDYDPPWLAGFSEAGGELLDACLDVILASDCPPRWSSEVDELPPPCLRVVEAAAPSLPGVEGDGCSVDGLGFPPACAYDHICLPSASGDPSCGICMARPGEGEPCLDTGDPDGGTCRRDLQCIDGQCVAASGDVSELPVGDACPENDPPCHCVEGICADDSGEGGPCSDSGYPRCRGDYVCEGGVCVARADAWGAVGQGCTNTACQSGLVCRDLVDDNLTVRVCSSLLQAGSACYRDDECDEGLLCIDSTCNAPRDDGEPCDYGPDWDPYCASTYCTEAGICGPAPTCGG